MQPMRILPATVFSLVVTLLCAGFLTALMAQENLEELYLRKAVKAFVGKQYDEAIADLEQVMTINHDSPKARKLLAKCYEREGSALLSQNRYNEAEAALRKALEYDPANADATAALAQVGSLRQSLQSTASGVSAPEQRAASNPQQALPAPVAAAPAAPIVITPQMMGGGDSNQAKVVNGLLKNFERQQDMMAKQMDASNHLITNTDDVKDKYLRALMAATEQKNSMMKTFILVGGIVVFGVIVVVLLVFMIIFRWFAKSSELRTIQATETITALLAAPQAAGGSPLLLAGPSVPVSPLAGSQPADGIRSVTLDALNTADPIRRADAVEAVAAEIIDNDQAERLEKIKKLGELLKDDNNRVRANAAKALYEVDKESSLRTLHDMLQSESNRMRASAMWALGEINTEEALELILTVDGEADEIVNYNIKMALEKIKTRGKFPVTAEIGSRIDARLVQYAGIA